MSEKYTAEQIERAAVFYEQSPTGQYDDEAAYALRELTTLRAENAELKADIQTLIKCLPDQNWNDYDDRNAFMEVAAKHETRAALQAGENDG